MRRIVPPSEFSGKEADMMFQDKNNGAWHTMFNICANSLHWLASKLDPLWPGGMDYVKINVILFCVLLPIILLGSLALNLAFLFGLL
jgi:hypothetical protein